MDCVHIVCSISAELYGKRVELQMYVCIHLCLCISLSELWVLIIEAIVTVSVMLFSQHSLLAFMVLWCGSNIL